MEYVIQEGKLDNKVHDISYEQLRLLYEDNLKEAEESERITQSSYRGENYYGKYDNFHYELQQEYLVQFIMKIVVFSVIILPSIRGLRDSL